MLIRVCILIVARIAQLEPAICDRCILIPLSQPINIRVLFSGLELGGRSPSIYEQHPSRSPSYERVTFQSSLVVSEGWCTHAAVEMMHLLLTSCPINRALVDALHRCGINESMLSLYMFAFGQRHLQPSNLSLNAAAPLSGQLFSRLEQFSLSVLKQEGQRAARLLLKVVIGGSNDTWHYKTAADGLIEIRRGKEGKIIQLPLGDPHGDRADDSRGDDDLNRTLALAEVLEAQSDGHFCLSLATTKLRVVARIVEVFEEEYQSYIVGLIGSQLDGCPHPQVSPGGFECIGAQLFLELLHIYLLGQSMGEMNLDPTTLTALQVSPQGSPGSQSLRALHGVLVVYFQSLLPLSVLLRDGNKHESQC